MLMIELRGEPRIIVGKKVKHIAKNGLLPGVLYGAGIATQSIAVSFRDFEHVYREAGESTLVKLDVAGNAHTILIHDIAHDPLSGRAIHADFYAVSMDKVIRVGVPIVFFGESEAVKNAGGILVKVAQELEVEALPQDLPHEFRVDLSLLVSIESRIFVRDVSHEAGVKIIADSGEVVALVETPRSEEALAELTAKPIAEIKEVETEREIKAREKSKEVKPEEESK